MKNPLKPIIESVVRVTDLLVENLPDTLMILGGWLIAVGVALISVPLGIISLGVTCLSAGALIARAESNQAGAD